MSRVDELHPRFEEYNLTLQLFLGLLSVTERIEKLLPPPEGNDKTDAPEPTDLDCFAAMLLGVVSFRRRLLDLADEVGRVDDAPSDEARPPGDATPPASSRSLRELLR